ncbi:hypothetical protein CEP52_011858 [Fusarium oligoseptatum]|uniref:Uncharacterized protein n=1 Tax=Fusarium oligoseptatum TaxID=2604345 RepID=A0A428T166_9HYPO|nr:hypothetical protein CEP52_011858 [Fusarium oligoseptatum]
MSTRSSASDSNNRASASVLELTQQCISLLEGCVNPNQNEDTSALETRLADLRLWADGVGALAQGAASLEWRFRSRPEDLLLVKTILIMLADFVEDYSTFLQAAQPIDEALERIDSTIENLALISVAIRRTGKASRRRRADARFDPRDYEEFRRHLECIILLRPSKSGLQNELKPSGLNIVQNRLIEANLKRRHRFVIAQKRFRKVEGASQPKRHENTSEVDASLNGMDKQAESQPAMAPGVTSQQSHHQREAPTKDGLTAASTAGGTLHYVESRRYVPGATRTQITALAADAEFPKPPLIPERGQISKCPCCCQSIPVGQMLDPEKWRSEANLSWFPVLPTNEAFRQHIIEDLLPYTCIIEDCPTPQTAMFSTRKEWEAHVNADHRTQWHCPLCEEVDVIIESEEAIAHHLETEHQNEVKEFTLETLLLWSEIRPMGINSCPLCSSFGREDSPEIIDHILRHVYDFSLRALPWTKPFTHDLNKSIGTFVLPNDKHLAARLVEWVDQAEGNTGQKLQLSPQETANHERDIPETIDDTGYVSEKDYF